MSGEFRARIGKIKGILKPQKMAQAAHKEFVKNTPVGKPSTWKSGKAPKNYVPGNARRRTTLQNSDIVADYPYATRLDNGWSKQSPNGMVEPTIKFLQDYIKKNLGK